MKRFSKEFLVGCLVLLVVGLLLTVTILGAVIGIPLMALGFALLLRGIF